MRKFLILLGILLISCSNVFAAKIPVEVKDYILEKIPQADIRFDGVIILPDNTIYLPLYPSLFSNVYIALSSRIRKSQSRSLSRNQML